MTPEFEKDSFLSLKKLSANNHYYNEVFKRTERIASVVFYVLSYIEPNVTSQVHHNNLTNKAMRLHETIIATLNLHEYETKDGLGELVQTVVGLESAIRLAAAARVITTEVERVLTEEIDVLLRVIRNHYVAEDQVPSEKATNRNLLSSGGNAKNLQSTARPTTTSASLSSAASRQARSAPRGDISSQASVVYGTAPARSERIKTVLEAKGEATIKDIADVITDCSEKTIQRDLNALIKSGEVERHGERRWSRYTVVKS